MPPVRGEIWEQFTVLHDAAGKLIEARCKHRQKAKYASPNATRLLTHITKCSDVPPALKQHYNQQLNKKKGQQNVVDIDQEEDFEDTLFSQTSSSINTKRASDNAVPASPLSAKRQRSITSSLDIVTKEEKQKLDGLFSKALLSKGLPFNVFEGEHMEAAFKALRPANKLPSRKSFAGPLLNQEYNSIMNLVNVQISKARCLTVELNGWNNNRNEGIINFVVCTPQPFFYKAIEPGTQRENSDSLSEHILCVLGAVNAHKVLLLVTDNASAMKRAWTLVQKVHPHIHAIGCGSHGLNLLFKDILKLNVFKELISKA
ncbi:hypothetical protein KUF71_024325 [Frankliniella fusca]|uniref:DUF659 domain-containing protein n=1 Tax=Frankliniella fusca TaxID=407009 RepID=A0AAE1LCY8_9NEOP|nr:hypothetical protein KUF71_024325 [Frankliniella fusca]